MILVIAEKPQLGSIIAEAIGIINRKDGYIECKNNHIVTWAFGHILEFMKPDEVATRYRKWKIEDLPFSFELQLRPKENSYKQFNIIKNLLSKANTVINAGDPDDEGELLIREILDYVGYEGELKRLILNDLNINSAKKALNNLKDGNEFDGYYHRALARSKADYIYGLNLSRLFTIRAREKGYQDIFTVGRVQTPTLGLIVNRYLENKNHKESFYYTVQATVSKNSKKQNANLILEDRILDIDIAEKYKNLKGKTLKVQSLVLDQKIVKAPLPFSLLDLQAKVSSKHKIKVDKVLEITQNLREKYKAITYNRSDCNYLTSEQLEEAPKTVVFLTELLKIDDKNIDTSREMRAFNDSKVTAHTAIIPTFADFKFEDLTAEEKIVYTEIANQYLAQFYPDKVYTQAIAILEAESGEKFDLRANLLVESGWEKLLGKDEKNKEEMNSEKYDFIKNLNEEEDFVFCDDILIKRNKTKPRPLYSEATLLKDLQSVAKYVKNDEIKKLLREQDAESGSGERGGIGTPATRSTIIKNLHERGFFNYEKNRLIPTKKGIDFIKALPQIIVEPDMTAIWYEKQKEIGEGNLNVSEFINEVNAFVAEQVSKEDILNLEPNGTPCECGGRLILKKTKNGGEFFGCTNFPDCKITKGAIDGKEMPKCPSCNSDLRNTPKVVSCINNPEACTFFIFKEMAGKKLSNSIILELIKNQQTSLIKGFKSKAGKSFNAKLKVENGAVKFQFDNDRKKKSN